MTILEKAKAKLDAAQRGMSYRLPGYDKSDLQWWTAYIEGAEDQKREDQEAAGLPWRSVEQPPKKNGKYLVCWKDGGGFCYDTAWWTSVGTWSLSHWTGVTVTHWMSVEPPEEVQE